MKDLFEKFLREKTYLANLPPRTLQYFRWVFNRWKDLIGEFPDKENIKEFVIKVQESGVATTTANSYIRGFNSFLTWL